VPAEVTLREGRRADAPVMAETIAIGFATYREFAPPGWEPPPAAREEQLVRARFGDDAWVLMAFDGDEPAGHVSLLPDPDPLAAYLWHLFVRPPHWGTGLAHALHIAFMEAARARGYARGRLRTPAGQARARRFYERRGWVTDGVAAFEEGLGLELLVYTRPDLT
jgi:GNAT superfamily N-acetyltransferase